MCAVGLVLRGEMGFRVFVCEMVHFFHRLIGRIRAWREFELIAAKRQDKHGEAVWKG